MHKKGFSLLEIMIVVAIIGILSAIAVINFSAARKAKILETTADGIAFTLEKAKADSVSGKYGQSHGLKFNTGDYISFVGSSYNAGNASNTAYTIDDSFTITNTITDPDDKIVFLRLTGATNNTATVTVSQISDSTKKRDVVIGPLGNISVVQ